MGCVMDLAACLQTVLPEKIKKAAPWNSGGANAEFCRRLGDFK
jgi:hypothetical protein